MIRAVLYVFAIFVAASTANASSWRHVTENVYVDTDSIARNGDLATATIKAGSMTRNMQFNCNYWEAVDLTIGERQKINVNTVGGAVLAFVCSHRSDGCWRMPGHMESGGYVPGDLVCP